MADAQGNRYGPYDIEVPGSQSEPLTEDAWFELFGEVSGVKSGGALTFAGLTATLSAINVRVFGSYLIRADPWSSTSLATDTSAPRRDMLVARRQRTTGEGVSAVPGKTFLTVLQGTSAVTPAEPADFNAATDEPLWSWQVPGGGGTVVTDIRDYRRSKCVLSRSLTVAHAAAWLRVNGWSQTRRHPFFTVNSDGTVTFLRDGHVQITAQAHSDHTGSGISGARMALPDGVTDFADGYLTDNRWRGSGFGSAGRLTQPLTWSGRVKAGQTTSLELQQVASDGSALAYEAHLSLEYVRQL